MGRNRVEEEMDSVEEEMDSVTERRETSDLPEELRELQRRWIEADRAEQERLYAAEFGPRYAPLFAKKRLELAPPSLGMWRPRALVSVLGLSWQPAALMAAWAKPDRVLLLGTAKSLGEPVFGEPVVELIARVSGVSRSRFRTGEAGEHGEVEIYRAVRDFCAEHGYEPGDVLIDPTGGKKSMSVAAALAGFLLGARMAYVDYREYHGERRIPVAGTEYPRLLANPLDELGDLEFDRIRRAFDAGNFLEAQHRAEDLAGRLYEPRLAELYRELARAYGAWEEHHLKEAREALACAGALIERHRTRPEWGWASALRPVLDRHSSILASLEAAGRQRSGLDEGLPIVWNHLAAAERALERGRHSQAVVLLYATVERFAKLYLKTELKVTPEGPLPRDPHIDLDRFHQVGELLFPDYKPRDIVGHWGYGTALHVAATLRPELIRTEDLGVLRDLGKRRNRSGWIHELVPEAVTQTEARRLAQGVKGVLSRVREGLDLDAVLADYAFPRLASLGNQGAPLNR